MDGNSIQFYNAKVITPDELLENAYVLVENGKITAVTKEYTENFDGESVDVSGEYLCLTMTKGNIIYSNT